MAALDSVIAMNTEDFFRYVKSIRYGYQDRSGRLHFIEDEDFAVQDYSFSSPEEIVNNSRTFAPGISDDEYLLQIRG